MSYNSNYEDSNVFTLGGMTTVGLTDCGLQCKVACGCNTANGWYRAVPDGNYTSRTSVKSYDFVIGDDGKLASSGTTLSSAGRTLSGSTKSLSAGGSTITCTKQTCSDGYITTKPGVYFSYDTETLRHGEECYNVTGCASGYASNGTGSGTTLDGYTCYKIQYYTVTIEAKLDDINSCPSSLTSKVGTAVSSCSLDGSSCTPSLGSSTTKTIRRVRGADSYSISLGQDGCYTMGEYLSNDWYLYSNGIQKNGDYMSTEVGSFGPSASDTITGDTTYSLMFNCGKGQCPEDCEYTTTSSDCSNAGKYLSDNTCVINGTTYYKGCGSTKCASDETCNGSGTCVCDYSTTKASCDTECKYTGTQCSDGTAYYNGCGSSKCASDQECYNGECGCKYTTTKATCDAECKYTGTQCSDGTAYYNGCGSSKCSSGQICLNGSCHTHSYYCSNTTGASYPYDSESAASPHASSADNQTTTCSCGATSKGTCYAQGSHSYTCGSGYSSNSGDYDAPIEAHKQYCSKCCDSPTGCTVTNSTQCYKEGCSSDTYNTTELDCSNACKNNGSDSCVRDGVTYYSSCGSSKCDSNETCSDGFCVTNEYFPDEIRVNTSKAQLTNCGGNDNCCYVTHDYSFYGDGVALDCSITKLQNSSSKWITLSADFRVDGVWNAGSGGSYNFSTGEYTPQNYYAFSCTGFSSQGVSVTDCKNPYVEGHTTFTATVKCSGSSEKEVTMDVTCGSTSGSGGSIDLEEVPGAQ